MQQKRKVSVRKSPSQQRSKQMVEKIMAAAKMLLIEQGLENLTTSKVASYAQISVGSLYQYFPNKLAILQSLYMAWLDEVIVELEEMARIPTMSPDEFINVLREVLVEYYNPQDYQNSSAERKFELELTKGMQLYNELKEIDDSHQEKVASIIADCLKRIYPNQPYDYLLSVSMYLYCVHCSFDEVSALDITKTEDLIKVHINSIIASISSLA